MIKAYIKYWKKAGDLKSYSNRSDLLVWFSWRISLSLLF
ncbi:hypothetical protein ICE98_00825 [Lactococcus lactis]|nr:hypothetical protein [Lactococcus lactis]